MRDKKDNATFDLPGFDPEPSPALDAASVAAATESRRTGPRPRRAAVKQEQLTLLDLDAIDATGLPVWQRDPDLDLTGLPIWQPAT